MLGQPAVSRRYSILSWRQCPSVFAQQSKKSEALPRDSASNKSLIHKVSTTIEQSISGALFVQDLLHRTEGTTLSRVIRRCQPAVYRVWMKGMTGTYPTYTYLKRVGLAST